MTETDKAALLGKAVVIGASAGAVQALLKILPALPSDFSWPVLIVVHVPPDRSNALVALYKARCQITVKEAEDKEQASGSTVYFAPSDYHLLIEKDGCLALSADELVNHSRPAIDILMETAADAYGDGLTAIILTGANGDGAAGLRAVVDAGGFAIVENPATAQSSTMPMSALQACPTARIMTIDEIASYLRNLPGL